MYEDWLNKLKKSIAEKNTRRQYKTIVRKTLNLARITPAKAEFENEKASEAENSEQCKQNSGTKLPQLPTTKFDGKFESWLPFWEKFTSEIESTKIPTLTKFAYLLKELLDESVRCDIDEVGYSKAKDILETECGQSAEVANAYTVQ